MVNANVLLVLVKLEPKPKVSGISLYSCFHILHDTMKRLAGFWSQDAWVLKQAWLLPPLYETEPLA